jgi:hypothetical protein
MRSAKVLALAALLASMIILLIPRPAAAMFCDDYTPVPNCTYCQTDCLYVSDCTGWQCQLLTNGEYSCVCTIIPPP